MFLAEVLKFSAGGSFSHNVSFLTTKRSHVPANIYKTHKGNCKAQWHLEQSVTPEIVMTTI